MIFISIQPLFNLAKFYYFGSIYLYFLDLRNYINSSEFIVVETWAEYHVIYYPCCGDEPFPDITYYIRIQRRPAFHIYILILPSILLSFLTLVLFWIPPQRPDRTSLGKMFISLTPVRQETITAFVCVWM